MFEVPYIVETYQIASGGNLSLTCRCGGESPEIIEGGQRNTCHVKKML